MDARTATSTSTRKRILASREPPYPSSRVLVRGERNCWSR